MELKNALRTATLALMSVGLLAVTACSPEVEKVDTAEKQSQEVKVAVFSGWDEGIAVSYLWQNILEEKGYDLELTTLDAGPAFASLASGEFDVNFDAWLPGTHSEYMKKFGSQLEEVGVWYDNAKLTIAVNEDSPAKSLEDLAGMADQYGNKLVGIEEGAGLTRVTRDDVIPGYGLEKVDYVTSSTPAMLAELKGATSKGENVAVTLWKPHWAYSAFPVRDLEDPKGLLGDPEQLTTIAKKGFGEEFPELKTWFEDFKLTDEQLFGLEELMFNKGDGSDESNKKAVEEWVSANQEAVNNFTK